MAKKRRPVDKTVKPLIQESINRGKKSGTGAKLRRVAEADTARGRRRLPK